MKLLLKRGLFVPDKNEVIPAGKTIEVDDKQAERLIADGVAVNAETAEAESKPSQRSGEVLDQFVFNDFTYSKVTDPQGVFYTLEGENTSEEIDESAYTNALQASKLDEEVDQPQPPLDGRASQNEEALQGIQPQNQANTEQQIQNDLEQLNEGSKPSESNLKAQ